MTSNTQIKKAGKVLANKNSGSEDKINARKILDIFSIRYTEYIKNFSKIINEEDSMIFKNIILSNVKEGSFNYL